MTNPIRVGVQLWPGGTPDYRTWREAVLTADELGADAIFGYDHFHKPFTVPSEDGLPQLLPEQLDVKTSKGGPRWLRGPRSPAMPTSGCWSPGSVTAIPTCWPTWPAPSTTSAVDA